MGNIASYDSYFNGFMRLYLVIETFCYHLIVILSYDYAVELYENRTPAELLFSQPIQ